MNTWLVPQQSSTRSIPLVFTADTYKCSWKNVSTQSSTIAVHIVIAAYCCSHDTVLSCYAQYWTKTTTYGIMYTARETKEHTHTHTHNGLDNGSTTTSPLPKIVITYNVRYKWRKILLKAILSCDNIVIQPTVIKRIVNKGLNKPSNI